MILGAGNPCAFVPAFWYIRNLLFGVLIWEMIHAIRSDVEIKCFFFLIICLKKTEKKISPQTKSRQEQKLQKGYYCRSYFY